MVVSLLCDPALPRGNVSLPPGLSISEGVQIRLGCLVVEAVVSASSLTAEIHLAPDLWERLGAPCEGLRLRVMACEQSWIELGPSVAVLCPGGLMGEFLRTPAPFDHLEGEPGLFALGFESGIDWEKGQMNGYLLDNRLDSNSRLVAARFPLPAVIRLVPGVQPRARRRLRELTGRRAYNSVRSIGRWRCHALLAQSPAIRLHLPETRPFRGAVDLAALLVRYTAVLLMIRGCRPTSVSRAGEEFRVAGMAFSGLAEAAARVRELIGGRKAVIQRRVSIAVRVRILVVQEESGRWRPALHTVTGAPGGTLAALVVRFGLNRKQARRCLRSMERLCRKAARILGKTFHPLGILGFDVGVESRTDHLWLLSVQASPRWPSRQGVRQRIARTQVEYGLSLAGEGHDAERLPR